MLLVIAQSSTEASAFRTLNTRMSSPSSVVYSVQRTLPEALAKPEARTTP